MNIHPDAKLLVLRKEDGFVSSHFNPRTGEVTISVGGFQSARTFRLEELDIATQEAGVHGANVWAASYDGPLVAVA